MDRRMVRVSLTAIVALYLLLVSSCNAQPGYNTRYQDRYRTVTIKRQNYDKDVLQLLYRDIDRQRRGHHMSDAGYGSRVQAGSKVANALIAHHLYGAYGPGRRKRSVGAPKRALAHLRPF